MANEIDGLLQEHRTFSPSVELKKNANAKDESVYDISDREKYWAAWADQLTWEKRWNRVLEWNPPYAKWFVGGRLNASANCLDRHLQARGDKKAIIWEGEPGDTRTYTYRQLHAEVSKFAREAQSHDLLHRTDRNSRVHEMGREAATIARPLVASTFRIRR